MLHSLVELPVLEKICIFSYFCVESICAAMKELMKNFEIDELFDAIVTKLAEHRFLRLIIFISALSCAIPVVTFIIFGITSVIITFTGFLFIEGTLLAIGGLFMFVCTATMVLVMSVFALTSVALYVLTLNLGFSLSRFNVNSNVMKRIVLAVTETEETEIPVKSKPINVGNGR